MSDITKFEKPNVRKIFLPDLGHVIFDADLKQADAQIVAWDAGAENLKAIFRAKEDLHRQNAKDIYQLYREPTKYERQQAKHGVHATNFVGSPRTMANKLGMTVHQATQFQARWFKLHPEIKEWHQRIENQLMATRTVRNAFGYRRIFFERVQNLLPEAVAWIPQSTTVNIIDKAMNNIEEHLSNVVELLLQVHDSAIGQFHSSLYPSILPKIREQMLITVPYDDPLVIDVDVACSTKSWGDAKQVSWDTQQQFCPY